TIILAHDGAEDPHFIYVNKAAQKLWELPLEEFIGLASHFSVEPDRREERQRMLDAAALNGYYSNYKGIRISNSGRRFYIENVILWNLLDAEGRKCGQAAMFNNWTYLED
ncbi:MAG: MEKHLA domain-containing protein, partial [Lentisphaeraceae bacterium]|nr:MEKHLA domain-containing protein [Lentisphaeraceae bacterium]